MSYHYTGQQQYNPSDPNQSYSNQYLPHSQQSQPASNQNPPSNTSEYASNYPYPAQPYDGQNAPVGSAQQPQNQYSSAYTSPHLGAASGNYTQSQQQSFYQAPMSTYNPQHYVPVSNQPQQSQHAQYPPTPTYNPQAYASPTQSAYAPSPLLGSFSDHRQYGTVGQSDRYGFSPALSPAEFASQPGSSPQIPQQSPSIQYSPQVPPRQQSYVPQAPAVPTRPYSYSASSTGPPQLPNLPYRTSGQRSPPLSATFQRATPYPQDDRWVPSPPQHHVSTNQPSSQIYQTTTNTSLPSPSLSTTGPTPPAHGAPARPNVSPRHPQARPLPGPPGSEARNDYFEHGNAQGRFQRADSIPINQEDLFNEIEDAFISAGAQSQHRQSPKISSSHESYAASSEQRKLNGHLSPPFPSHDPFNDESDPEAAQGLAMMQAAEEEDQRRISGTDQSRFTGLGTQLEHPQANPNNAPMSSDSDDYGMVDMSSFGGGYDVQMSYGGDSTRLVGSSDTVGDLPNPGAPTNQNSIRRLPASRRSSRRGQSFSNGVTYAQQSLSEARVDARGTGGLSEPTGLGRRQSYDEGDEDFSVEAQLPERFPDEPPDISFNAASTTFLSGRPLPPPPPLDTTLANENKSPGLTSTTYEYGHVPDVYIGHSPVDSIVPRSSSFVGHSNTPTVIQPSRSKTDAEERTRRQQQILQIQQQSQFNQMRSSTYSLFDSVSGAGSILDLPPIGAKRFVPAKLGAPDFKKCAEPWGLSSILKWLLTIVSPEQYAELKEVDITDALINLFTNKVPTMNIADAEGLAHRVVQDMYKAGTLVATEEWVKLVPGTMSGVIFQLTSTGCYAPTLHEHIMPGRCYSHFCQRTLKKLSLNDRARGSTDWAQFYNLERAEWEGKDKKELERQYILHEIVHTEDAYIDQLSVLQSLYRDPLSKVEPSIITPGRRDKFIKDVFGRLDAIKQANLDHLLPQLKYRQQEQGPFILGFSDIFRQWIRKAKAAYLEYAGGFPGANFLVRNEIERNLDFRNFMDRASKDPRSMRLGWDTYLKAPITRLQRYSLLLSTVLKNMQIESEERKNLQVALDEIKGVTHECDIRVAEMARKVDLTDLGMKLKLRPGMQNAVELNLDHFGREVIYRGDLQRMGGNRFTWLDSHAILFDHYLVIAKTIAQHSEQGGKVEKYDVSRLPIPMDLLILESSNDGAVQKSSYVKGITSVSTVSGRTAPSSDPTALGRTSTNQSPAPGALQHANTGNSSNSLQPVTSLDTRDSDRIMYPFKVKHLGRETYTLFAPNESARNDWVTKITEAKTKHAASLYAQNAEPFKLRVMADSAFVFDAFGVTGRGTAPVIRGTPIHRAIKEVEHRFKDVGKPGPICRARVNCATTFTTPHPSRQMIAVGTDFGIFFSEIDNPRGWTKAISMSRVSQIAVLEEFNLFLLISDKVLIAYHLDVICPNDRNGPTPVIDSARKAPQKLSGSKDVGFFACGRMKDRTLVFYKKRENLASVFKVLEPIYQKSTEKKRGVFKRGTTDFFREYDEFYIPAESSGINLFHSSLAVSTARGFEVLTLDKKQPWSIPELRAEHVQNIASHIKDQKALGMLRLSDQEFLLCYSNCAVYVNKHGDVSRSVIMDFVGTAQSAALYGIYLILFDSDFVEIRNASNGRLKQIIAGREIKCLDDGGNWSSAVQPQSMLTSANMLLNKETMGNGLSSPIHNGRGSRTVKFVMQHPESEKTQLVVELLLNENMKE